MRDLDEADASFAESSGQQALPRERGGLRVVETVESFRGLGLSAQVEDFRCLGLHAEGEFEGFDAGFERRVGTRLCEVTAVHLPEEIELRPLERCVFVGVVQILDRGLFDRFAAADPSAVMDRRKEAAGIVPDAAMAERRIDRDEARQVLVLGAEAVRDPGTHAGADEGIGSRVQFEERAAVRLVGAVDGFDHAQVVRARADEREQIADHRPASTVRTELPGRSIQVRGLRELDPGLGEGKGFP